MTVGQVLLWLIIAVVTVFVLLTLGLFLLPVQEGHHTGTAERAQMVQVR